MVLKDWCWRGPLFLNGRKPFALWWLALLSLWSICIFRSLRQLSLFKLTPMLLSLTSSIFLCSSLVQILPWRLLVLFTVAYKGSLCSLIMVPHFPTFTVLSVIQFVSIISLSIYLSMPKSPLKTSCTCSKFLQYGHVPCNKGIELYCILFWQYTNNAAKTISLFNLPLKQGHVRKCSGSLNWHFFGLVLLLKILFSYCGLYQEVRPVWFIKSVHSFNWWRLSLYIYVIIYFL